MVSSSIYHLGFLSREHKHKTDRKRTSHEHGATLALDIGRDTSANFLNDADDITAQEGVGGTEESGVLPAAGRKNIVFNV